MNHKIPRRDFLTGLAKILGAGAAASLLTTTNVGIALAYERRANPLPVAGQLCSRPQMQMLMQLCELILPKTDTPSAGELDCHGFVDHQLLHCYDKGQQQDLLAFLDRLEQFSLSNFEMSFTDLPDQKQTQLLESIENGQGLNAQDPQSFSMLKNLVVFGYFTSEIGATQALKYQAVPGGYVGSVPYKEGDKAWGSLSYY